VTTSVYNTLDFPVWTYDGTGSWQDSVNWQNGVLAQGNGVIADFSTLATGGVNEVWLDGPRTVGQLAFGDQGDQFGWTLSTGSGGTLTLNNGASSPVVNVINQTTTISAPVTSGNGLVKTGAGTLVLNDVNAINGAIDIRQGTLEANNAGAFGAATNAATLGDASTGANVVGLNFGNGVAAPVNLSSITNSNFGVSQQITLNAGAGLPANNRALATTLNLTGSVPVTLKALNTGGHSTAQDVNWRITGTGIPAGSTALILDGSTHALRTSQMNDTSAASAFTGDVLIKGPVTTQGRTYFTNTPEHQNLNFLQNNITVESGTWSIVWGGETIGALNGAGNVNLNCQSALNNIGLTLGNTNVAGTHTGVISGGFALSKVGTASQTLGGANTYSGGTTVNAGTLTLTNTTGSGTGSGAVTVKSGATLAGTGSASNTTTVESGGTVAPGTSGTGTLTLATASAAGTYQCQLDGATGDRLTVTGTLTIQPGAAINVSTLGTPTASSYTILSYATLTGTLPTITGVPEGYSVDTTTAGQVKLVGGNAFDSWINGFASLTDPADKTPTADPDHDGLANIVEFVLNGNPANGAITNLPTLTASGANLVFTFTRRDDSESLNPTVEFDADLSGVWTTAVDGSNCTIVVTENDANPDTVTVTIPKQANARLFARLRVNP
jgi:autotransporter-associated beta strand protein